ncbi:MAG: hypothetical protein JXA18_16360 [Chitinispirillaceae bacterium]|nr:hypothetical protein [Chitinispirillaceae bacterium]
MKRWIVSLALVWPLLAGCIQFSTQYERIDADKVRLLDFVYEPAEAAPGDTVELRALFAGKALTPEAITWRVSYKVVKTLGGLDTALDERPLECVAGRCSLSQQTSCISVHFVIPEDCIAQSPMVKENVAALFTDELRDMLPPGIDASSVDQTVGLVDYLSHMAASADSQQLGRISDSLRSSMPEVMAQLPLLLQLLTVQIRLFADIAGEHRIQSDYSVSYHRRFAPLPGAGIYENHNPAIDSVRICKVKGIALMSYDPQSNDAEFLKLSVHADSATVVTVDKGYTYFIEVAAGGRDSVYTIGDIAGGKTPAKLEDLTAEWFFQMEEEEIDGLSPNDLMNIAALGDLNGILAPPRKKQVTHFTVWVQVTDSKLGIMNRSQGSMIAEVHGRFEYSDAYLEQFK